MTSPILTNDTSFAAVEPESQLELQPLSIVDQLLRDWSGFIERIDDRTQHVALARALLVTICAAAAVFGVTIGTYRMVGPHPSLLQVFFAAIKLPLVVLLTAGLTVPALSGIGRALRGETSLTKDTLIVLSALALGSMCIAGCAPVVLLAIVGGAKYHAVVLTVVGCCAASGLMAMVFFMKAMLRHSRASALTVTAVTMLVFCIVGAQMAWAFRPYLVRPRATTVPFMRNVEDGFVDAVFRSTRSARGIYVREAAPLPEEQ